MRKYFYVDTENLNYNEWSQHLVNLSKQDVIIFMVSEHSANLSLKDALIGLMNICESCKIEIYHCNNGLPNAMDFCLVSVFGRFIERAPKSKHIILSDDKGYDSVVEMYSEQGYKVERCGKAQVVINIDMKTKLEDMPFRFKSEWDRRKKYLLTTNKDKMPRKDLDSLINKEYLKLKEKYIGG